MRRTRAIRSGLRQLLPVLIVLITYAVVALILCGLPLFSVLGYESAFVFAIVGSLSSIHLSVVAVHRLRRRPSDPLRGPLSPLGGVLALYGRVLGLNLLLLVLPLDILLANAVHVRNCNFVAGLTWWLVLPVLSVVVATAWGVLLGLLPWRQRWAALAGYLLVLASLLWGFWRFYAEAPICQYDPFAGYFSGSLYDAHIEVTTAILAARLYHLAGAAAVLLVTARFFVPGDLRLAWRAPADSVGRRGLTVAVLGAVAVVLGLYFAGGPLAYTISTRNLARALGGQHHTPHFVIHYPKGSLTDQELALHAADAEFRWHQLRRFYGKAPAHKIRIFYFADDAQKRRLYGASDVDMAKPWRLEVYLTQRSFPHPVLKHELAHAFSAVFGDRAFGVSFRWGRALGFIPVPLFNPGLIEGSAVAADWRTRGGMTRHQWARAMIELKKAPPMSAVMSYGFMASAAGRSYTLAGSFCRFLVRHHGAAAFRRVYLNGGDFRAVYGRSLSQLEAQWKKFLKTVPLSDRELDLARERFRPRPIFARPCIHEIARLDRVADRFSEQGRHGAAAATYRQMCRYDPGSPVHLLGLVFAETAQARPSAALAAAQKLWLHPATTPTLRARTLWLLANLAWRQGRLTRARELFAGAALFPLREGSMRDLTVRRMALADPALERSLRRLMVPRADESPSLERGSTWPNATRGWASRTTWWAPICWRRAPTDRRRRPFKRPEPWACPTTASAGRRCGGWAGPICWGSSWTRLGRPSPASRARPRPRRCGSWPWTGLNVLTSGPAMGGTSAWERPPLMSPNNDPFAAFETQMRAEGLPDIAIRTFAHHYAQLAAGETGQIPEAEISPARGVPDAQTLPASLAVQGRAALPRTVVIKLNGGLGTTMGLEKAKSLLPVKQGQSFLEIIGRSCAHQQVALLLMNSFATRDDSLAALAPWIASGADALPPDFLQHKVPKIARADLSPVQWEPNPELSWCPPGHGDLYASLVSSGLLQRLLEAGYEYAFVSNADNLGAVVDETILGHVAGNQIPFLMEVADRTVADRKGGHLAVRGNGQLVLRESAQCPAADMDTFQDVDRHRYFNTNNLWFRLPALRDQLDAGGGILPLPLIVNAKTVDPRDADSTPVYQLETAMGAAIAVIDGAAALRVDRTRFSPVKSTSDLLAIRSDAYLLTDDHRVVVHPDRTRGPLSVVLDPAHYKRIDQLDERFPKGAPSLMDCESLELVGDVRFGKDVRVVGNVRLVAEPGQTRTIEDGAELQG